MIHKQYNEIMANSKKKFSNLLANILPIHVLIKYKDKFKNYEQ